MRLLCGYVCLLVMICVLNFDYQRKHFAGKEVSSTLRNGEIIRTTWSRSCCQILSSKLSLCSVHSKFRLCNHRSRRFILLCSIVYILFFPFSYVLLISAVIFVRTWLLFASGLFLFPGKLEANTEVWITQANIFCVLKKRSSLFWAILFLLSYSKFTFLILFNSLYYDLFLIRVQTISFAIFFLQLVMSDL